MPGWCRFIANSPLSATPQFALDDRSLFQAGNAGDLADKIDYWIEHPEERAAQGRAYAAGGTRMRVDACVARAEDMYREAIHDCRFHGYKPPRQGRLRPPDHPDPDKANQQFYHASALKKTVFGAVTNFLTPLLLFIDGLFFGLRVEGRRHLRGIRGGAVTVMNHVHPMVAPWPKSPPSPTRQYFVSLRRNLELPFTGVAGQAVRRAAPAPDGQHHGALSAASGASYPAGGFRPLLSRRGCWCGITKGCAPSTAARFSPRPAPGVHRPHGGGLPKAHRPAGLCSGGGTT